METTHQYPRYIAICGKPTVGKSLAAELLAEIAGYQLVDDGGFLREIAISHFGASRDDVYTQEGKLRSVVINDAEMTWRDVLGRIGNAFEAQFGANVIPEIAYNGLPAAGRFVFPSCRREQGAYHRARGAIVLHLENFDLSTSPYDFDQFNKAHCNYTIVNDFRERWNGNLVAARQQFARDLREMIEWAALDGWHDAA